MILILTAIDIAIKIIKSNDDNTKTTIKKKRINNDKNENYLTSR